MKYSVEITSGGMILYRFRHSSNIKGNTLTISEAIPLLKLTTVAVRSKAWTVLARSNAEAVESNPTQGMHACVYEAALRRADPPSKKSYRLCIGSRNWRMRPRPNNGL
jgi:hypothetical protein